MKLNCKYSSTILNGKPTKAVPVQIGICRRDDTLQLHVTSKAKNEKIPVTRTNIKNIHDKFKDKGKATIEFKNPNYMIMLSDAQPLELDKALRLIKLASRGGDLKTIDVELNSIVPSLKQKDLKTHERITDLNDYPNKEGFSASLVELSISTHRLKSVDIRWFALKQLTTLDLSHNKLGLMDNFEWKKFNRISKLESLTTLCLINNGLTELPWEFIHSLPQSLEYLKLDYNKLTFLPDEICDLKRLAGLSAVNNPLEDLPEDFFYKCRNLRHINVFGTKIEAHPSFLGQSRLHYFSSSAIGRTFDYPLTLQPKVGSLFALASAKIFDNRDAFFSLPFNVRFRMRCELFRCVQCCKLYPRISKRLRLLQPVSTGVIAEQSDAAQGTRMVVNLIDSSCIQCFENDLRRARIQYENGVRRRQVRLQRTIEQIGNRAHATRRVMP